MDIKKISKYKKQIAVILFLIVSYRMLPIVYVAIFKNLYTALILFTITWIFEYIPDFGIFGLRPYSLTHPIFELFKKIKIPDYRQILKLEFLPDNWKYGTICITLLILSALFFFNTVIVLFIIISFILFIFLFDVNEQTFYWILSPILVNRTEDNILVRLNFALPTSQKKVDSEAILGKLFEFAHFKSTSGSFETKFGIHVRGLRVLEGIYDSLTQPTIQASVGVSKIADKSTYFIEIPKNNEDTLRSYLNSQLPGIIITTGAPTMLNCIKGYIAGDWRKQVIEENKNSNEVVNIFQNVTQTLELTKSDIELKYAIVPLHSHHNRIINRTFKKLATDKSMAGQALSEDEKMYQSVGNSKLFALEIIITSDSHQENLKLSETFQSFKNQRGNHIVFGGGRPNNQSVVSVFELSKLWDINAKLTRSKQPHTSIFPYPPEFIDIPKFYATIGKSNAQGFQDKDVGFSTVTDMCHHTRILATTGQGKSNLLRKIASTAFEDPNLSGFFFEYSLKGSTAINLHNYLPEHRIKDVIYIDPTTHSIPMTFMEQNIDKETAFNDIAYMLFLNSKQYMKDGTYGNRIDSNLHVLINFIAKKKTPTPYDIAICIEGFLADPNKLKQLQDSDDINTKLFATALLKTSPTQRVAYLSSVISNISKFLGSDRLISDCSADTTKLSFVDCIRQNKIVIINLASLSGTEKFSFGIFYAYKIQQAIKSMKSAPKKNDSHCLFFLEEAQNIIQAMGQEITENLSETRGLKTGYIMAHQFSTQIDEELNDAIDNLVHNKIYQGSLGETEITKIYQSLGINPAEVPTDKLRLLPIGSGIARSRINGTGTKPYSFEVEEVRKLNSIPLKDIVAQTKLKYAFRQAKKKIGIKALINNFSKLNANITESQESEDF